MKRSTLALVAGVLVSSAIIVYLLFGPVAPQRPDVEGIATVRYASLEGGCFYLESEDGRPYVPTVLPEEYRQEGLRVRFSARILEDGHSYCLFGTPVEILEISKAS